MTFSVCLKVGFLVSVVLGVAAFGSEGDGMHRSDLQFRGPVKECVERTTIPAQGDVPEITYSSTLTFSLEGLLLQQSYDQEQGRQATKYSYDSGRLQKVTSGNQGGTEQEFVTTYSYDDKGRLRSVAGSSGGGGTEYEYDEAGRKREVTHFAPIEMGSNTAVAGFPWHESALQLMPPTDGGTMTTLYDEQGRPTEAQVRNTRGELTVRLVRTYDEKGRMVRDKLAAEDVGPDLPDEMTAQMNEAQRKAMAAFVRRSFLSGESSYKYDSESRIIEKRTSGGVFGNKVVSLRYNDHGDVIEEDTTESPTDELMTQYGMDEAGNLIPTRTVRPPEASRSVVRYDYEYDAQGNWTKKTMTTRSGQDTEFRTSIMMERKLTYY